MPPATVGGCDRAPVLTTRSSWAAAPGAEPRWCASSSTSTHRSCADRRPACCCRRINPDGLALDYGVDADEIRRWRRRSPSQVRFVETFMHAALARRGKPRWGEKTPSTSATSTGSCAVPGRAVRARDPRRPRRGVLDAHPRHPAAGRGTLGEDAHDPVHRGLRELWRHQVEQGIRHRDNPRYPGSCATKTWCAHRMTRLASCSSSWAKRLPKWGTWRSRRPALAAGGETSQPTSRQQ